MIICSDCGKENPTVHHRCESKPALKIQVSELEEFKLLLKHIRHLTDILECPYKSPEVKANALEKLKEVIK